MALTTSPLGVLGFTADEDELYRTVLRSRTRTLTELAASQRLPVDDLRQRLQGLADRGVVALDGDEVVAVAPEQGLARLIAEETHRIRAAREQLDAARDLLPALTADHLAAQAPTGEPVTIEVVEGDALGLIRSLTAASTGDLLWMRPDQWRAPEGPEVDEWVKELTRAGRRSRCLYPARVLEEAPDVVRSRAAAGEHVRIVASVPSRVAIMGSSAALIPEQWGVNTDRRLVVRQEPVISALRTMFELMWERAMAVPGLDGYLDAADRVSERRLLLDQLAGGAKDEQIARALGISLRTVRRRVAEIIEELGVDSRFQAGVEAVRRGWV